MKDYKKTFLFPTICKGIGSGKGYGTMKVYVELRWGKFLDWETFKYVDGYELGISANAGRLGCVGQCLNEIYEKAMPYMNEADRNLFKEIYETWCDYNLNTMYCGTKRQTEFLNNAREKFDYKADCELLKENGLYEDNGHKYGHEWYGEQIPKEVVDKVLAW